MSAKNERRSYHKTSGALKVAKS